MKILYVTTIGLTMIFFKDLVKDLIEEGHTVDIACNETEYKVDDCYREMGCRIHPMEWSRSPLKRGNMRAVRELKRIVAEHQYDIVHCHTPIAGFCTRMACKGLRKRGVKVFYTAHGFHFYHGAPLRNWLVYYPAEKLCSRFTDTLITINREDYGLAVKRMKARRTEYIPGVGVDTDRFRVCAADRTAKRRALGIPEDAFLLLSVGELNENKNHQVVIRAVAGMQNPRIHYMIAGEGPLRERLQQLAQELGVVEQVHLLGYRNDVAELYQTADVNLFPSVREGLGLAAIEGMAAGLPLLCTDNRGTREYAGAYDEVGFHCFCGSPEDYCEKITVLENDSSLYDALSRLGMRMAETFSVRKINDAMKKLYAHAFRNG